jgi:hypothetical protein
LSGFFELSKVQYKSLGRRRYQYLSEDGGLVADVMQIQGGKPRGRFARLFAPERDYSDTALRATSPEGGPVFVITRTKEGVHGRITSCVYSADGTMAGKILADPEVWENRIMQFRGQLVDQEEVAHCVAVQRLISKGSKHQTGNAPVDSDKVDYANTYGTKIAFFDGKWMTLERALPEWLQLLVVASPIAFDLFDGA